MRVKDLITKSSSPTELKTLKMSFHLPGGLWTNTFSSLRVETMKCMFLSPEMKTWLHGFDLREIKAHMIHFERQRWKLEMCVLISNMGENVYFKFLSLRDENAYYHVFISGDENTHNKFSSLSIGDENVIMMFSSPDSGFSMNQFQRWLLEIKRA